MTVTGVIINSISVSISALTSLDWKKQVTHDAAFAQALVKCAQDPVLETAVLRSVGGAERSLGSQSRRRRGGDRDGVVV